MNAHEADAVRQAMAALNNQELEAHRRHGRAYRILKHLLDASQPDAPLQARIDAAYKVLDAVQISSRVQDYFDAHDKAMAILKGEQP